ncbi:hypothetical protein NA78x_005765 [Anatilimnocola sp. NA78]|uniref:hypothetical protein n=1 Tax=Anatilimnocola sp. NA78 TaxID=3415683 RepID=UPI003CE48CFC
MVKSNYECERCGLQLPLKTKVADAEPLHLWLCHNCGKRQMGVLDKSAREGICHNVQRANLGSFPVVEISGSSALQASASLS